MDLHLSRLGVNVMPVLPRITDSPGAVDALLRAVKAADASCIGACALLAAQIVLPLGVD